MIAEILMKTPSYNMLYVYYMLVFSSKLFRYYIKILFTSPTNIKVLVLNKIILAHKIITILVEFLHIVNSEKYFFTLCGKSVVLVIV